MCGSAKRTRFSGDWGVPIGCSPTITSGSTSITFGRRLELSILYAFYGLAGDPYNIEEQLKYFRFAVRSGYRFVGMNPRLIRDGRYFFASSHLPKHQIVLPPSGTFHFTALRDPVARVISLYRYLSNAGADSAYAVRRSTTSMPGRRMGLKPSWTVFRDMTYSTNCSCSPRPGMCKGRQCPG